MNTRTERRVDDWSTRSVDGYQGLRDLADEQFSGAVRARGTWLFMLNGRIVGVFEGAIEDFESASATAHEAPDPSLPLLFTMLEQGGEQQAKYYTEDTPVADADGTLSSGSFTGYIELSENVLSGDYYTVYYGGKSMSCAFVGNSEDLITGDDAFRRANDEVGIYEVRNVDIEVTDVPDPSGAAGGGGTGAADDDGNGASGADDAGSELGAGAGVSETTDQTTAAVERTGEAANGGDVEADDASGAAAGERAPDGRTPTERTADDRATTTDPATGGDDPAAAAERGEPDDTGVQHREPSADESAGTDAGVDPTHPTERESFDVPGPGSADPDGIDAPDPDELAESAERNETTDSAAEQTATDTTTERTATDAAATDPAEESASASAAVDAAEAAVDAAEPDDESVAGGTRRSESEADATAAARESYDADLGTANADSSEDEADPTYESEEEWQEARTIPSLDPDRTSAGDDESSADRFDGRQTRQSGPGRSGDASGTESGDRGSGADTRQSPERETASRSEASSSDATAADHTSEDEALKQEVLEREDRIDQLQQHVSNLESERDELRAERDEHRDEAESLRAEVADLEAEIERLEGEVSRLERELEETRRAAGGAPNASRQMGAAEALQGTNLFVRYASKGDATLEDAHAGNADAEAVNANLRLEHHTQFDSDDVAVDGKAFDEYLTGTLEFNFVDWVVGGLLYEIRDTGHATALEDLYDAVPDIDRAELKGNVSLVYTENGDEVREQKRFDVVLRDRMGNPLVVAELNDARDPVTQDGMATIESNASRLKESNEHLSAAFVVTSSFFDPGALETAAEATSGSFLSRDSKKSFVKLSRKQGYHLCLVESRGRDFHINVPEL